MKGLKKIKRIGIIYNLKSQNRDDDHDEEYDDIQTIESLRAEIEKYGFETVLIEQKGSFLEKITKERPDFVFNIAEGLGNGRSRESQIPCILESFNIPYSGSDSLSLGMTLDKYMTTLILDGAKIPVPLMHMIRKEEEIERLKNIFRIKKYFIVKPRWEGSSKGIFSDSVVDNFTALRKKTVHILNKYRQPALVEEFLEKEEITVGVCGNEKPVVLGMMKISPKNKDAGMFVYSLEQKRLWQDKIKYDLQNTIPVKTRQTIRKNALRAFTALELRDVARIDFRLDKERIPKIIDVNPLPGLSPVYSDLPILCSLHKKSYSELIKNILKESFKRNGIACPDALK